MSDTMTAMVQFAYGPPEILRPVTLPRPSPGPGDLLVQVHATTVTTGDVRMRASRFPTAFWLPGRLALGVLRPRNPVLGAEFAGVVVEVGAAVADFKVGDRVFGIGFNGAHAGYKRVARNGPVLKMPPDMDFGEAAALPFGGLTALYFLRRAWVGPGTRVLVNGASGAVGTAAIQLARHLGAEVTAVCSGRNEQLCRELGATTVIDYALGDFSLRPERYDVILDAVGNIPVDAFVRATDAGGRLLAVVGGGRALALSMMPLPGGRKTVFGVAEDRKEALEALMAVHAAGALKPVIDRRYPFSELVGAHAYVDTGRKRGAVVIDVTDSNSDRPPG